MLAFVYFLHRELMFFSFNFRVPVSSHVFKWFFCCWFCIFIAIRLCGFTCCFQFCTYRFWGCGVPSINRFWGSRTV